MAENGKKNTVPLQIVVIIFTIVVSVLTTYYVGEGEDKRKFQSLTDKDIHLEYRITTFEKYVSEDIEEIKETLKLINSKLDEL